MAKDKKKDNLTLQVQDLTAQLLALTERVVALEADMATLQLNASTNAAIRVNTSQQAKENLAAAREHLKEDKP